MVFGRSFVRDGERTRQRILVALQRSPGMNTSQLRLEVGLSWATVAYHLRVLERQGAVHLDRRARDTLCFPIDIPKKYRGLVYALRDGDTARVLEALREAKSMGIAQLSAGLGLPPKVVRRHLLRLEQEGLVTKKGELRPRFSVHGDPATPATDVAAGGSPHDVPGDAKGRP